MQSYNNRLSALSAVAPARKLQFLSKDIAKEVHGRAQSYQSRFLPKVQADAPVEDGNGTDVAAPSSKPINKADAQ